jgi:hypothetical protein
MWDLPYGVGTGISQIAEATAVRAEPPAQVVEILIARSVVYSKLQEFVVTLYTALKVCLVRMHAHSAGISS